MNNNSSQSRFAKVTAKVMIALLVVVMAFSAFPTLSADILPTASAAVDYVVPADGTIASINNQLSTYAAGTEVNVRLSNNLTITVSGDTHSSGYTGIVIPAGITVNLFMNGKTITFERSSGGAWQLPYVYAIHNKGTLNVYSGSSVTATSVNAAITLINVRTGMSTDTKRELAYCNLEGIRNEGNLTVNSKVTINVTTTLQYDKINTGGSLTNESASQVASGATAIYNASNTATCKVNGAIFNVSALSEGTYTSQCDDGERTDSVAVAYGIYGGEVTVSGDSKINVTSNGNHSRDTYMAGAENGKSYLTSIAYGIASSGSITVTGATITHDANITNTDACKSDGSGRQYLFSGGIYSTSGRIPMLPDVTITTPSENCMNNSEGTVTYRKGTVATSSEMINSATGIVSYMMSYREHEVLAPSAAVSAGTFIDEAHNSYAATMATSINAIPTGMTRGAIDGTNRVHVVYRYWVDRNRSAIDTSVVGTDGNVGYSYRPLTDGTNVVDKVVSLSGVKSQTQLTKEPTATVSYLTGGDSCNSYYWGLIDVAYSQPSTVFSDYNVASTANRGTVIKNFTSQGAANGSAPATNGPIYIFVDYARLSPTSIKAKVGTAGVVTTTYTGEPTKATDIGLQIYDSITEANYTSEYNVNFSSGDLIPVTYSYTGTNAAGITESSTSGQLPTNAGTYEVTLHIDESITYSKDPKLNKNRYELDYTFTLVIDQADILRGNLPTAVNLTYGQKLNEVLFLSTYTGQGIASDTNVTGVFSFTNVSDGTSYKNVGTQVVSVTWTPTYGSAAVMAKNYKSTVFNVEYTVNPAVVSVKPLAAAVVYGNEEFDTSYSVVFSGLVANDNTDAVKAQLFEALQFMIGDGTNYSAYVAGECQVGTYFIRARFSYFPDVLSNYTYQYVDGGESNPEGVLRVSQRPIIVEASAETNRKYEPNNFGVGVSFKITDGRFGQDDVKVPATTASLVDDNNNAGTREVSGISKQTVAALLAGGAAHNYYVAEVTYNTGATLLVEIAKGIPVVEAPTVAEMYYQRARTLKDISIADTASSVAGHWQWIDPTINPTVSVLQYEAQFVPEDAENYEVKTATVIINVKATPVIISYTGSVSYGDNIPNITAYTYKAELDPSFNIDFVTTSGNITPHTTYQKGSPVIDGGYPVEISAPNFVDVNGNYTFTTVNGVINVSPRNIVFTVQDTSIAYGENFVPSAATVNVTFDESRLVGNDTIENITANGTEPTFEYSTDFRYIDNYQVGSYYIKANPNFNTSKNYSVSTVQGTLKVTKAQLVIKADDITLEYGSAIPADIANAFTIVGAKRNEGVSDVVSAGEIKIDTTYQQNSPVNNEGYPITVDIAGAVFNNYTVNVQHGTITVIKATPKVTVLPRASIVHGQTLGDAVFTGGAVENDVTGKYLYDSASTAPAYRTSDYTIYTAAFIPSDTVNYNIVTGLIVPLTVSKKPISGALSVTGIPMVENTLTVDVSGLDPDVLGVYTITWYNENGDVVGNGKELALTETHKLHILTVKAVANAPYEGTAVCDTTIISPKLTSVETILTEEAYQNYFVLTGLSNYGGEAESVYTAQPHYVDFARLDATLNTASIGEVTVKYNGSTAAPTNVGFYTVTVDIATPDDVDLSKVQFVDGVSKVDGKAVFSPVSNYKIGTLVITPAPYYVDITVLDKEYDGTGTADAKVNDQYGACERTGGQFDDVSYDEESAVYYFSSLTVGTDKDVFVNNAKLKGAAANNYELLVSIANDAKANILKRTLYVKVVPVEREYEADNYSVDLSFEPVANSLAVGDEGFVYVNEALVSAAIDNCGAGLRNVTVENGELTGERASNYNLVLTNLEGLTVEILKATPYYPLPMTDVLYYDSARTLKNISLGDSRWSWDSEVVNVVPQAGVHSYKAVYTPDDEINYAVVEKEIELTIRKTVVTVTAANFNVTYGDTEPTYYYNVTGLTGADTIKNSVDGYVLMNCSYAAGSDVGLYDVVLTGAFESDNYDFVYLNGKVTVNKRAAYVEAIAESREYEAGNTKVNVTFSAFTNIYGTDAKNLYFEGTFPIEGTVENENAGIKSVRYTLPTLAGSKSANYELRLLNPNLTVEIKKAVLKDVILPKSGSIEYGQKLSQVKFTSSYEGTQHGTFSMENPTSTAEGIGVIKDKYKVVFTPYNTTNYATISEYIELTVIAAQLNIDITLTGTLQAGKSLYVLTNEIPASAIPYLYFEWYRVDSAEDDPRTGFRVAQGVDNYTLTESDEGKYIICTVKNSDDAPYTCYAKCVSDGPIEEESLTFWQKIINWFYRIISNITQLFGGVLG